MPLERVPTSPLRRLHLSDRGQLPPNVRLALSQTVPSSHTVRGTLTNDTRSCQSPAKSLHSEQNPHSWEALPGLSRQFRVLQPSAPSPRVRDKHAPVGWGGGGGLPLCPAPPPYTPLEGVPTPLPLLLSQGVFTRLASFRPLSPPFLPLARGYGLPDSIQSSGHSSRGEPVNARGLTDERRGPGRQHQAGQVVPS